MNLLSLLPLLVASAHSGTPDARASLYALCAPGIRYEGSAVTHRLIVDSRKPVKFLDQGTERPCEGGGSFEMSAALPDSYEPFYCLSPRDARSFLELDPADRLTLQSARERDGVKIEGRMTVEIDRFKWNKDSQSGVMEIRFEETGRIRYRWGKDRELHRKLDLTCAVQTNDPR